MTVRKQPSTVFDAIKEIAKYYHTTEKRLVSRQRSKEIALARQMAMALLRWRYALTYQHIGRMFERGHDTAMYNVQQIMESKDPNLRREFYELNRILEGI